MTETFPEYVNLDYGAGAEESSSTYPTLASKIDKSIDVLRESMAQHRQPALCWTGGKDSTLALFLTKTVAEEFDDDLPPVVFVDHLHHPPAVREFVDRWTDAWGLDLVVASNRSVGTVVDEHGLEPGDEVPISELEDRDKWHIRRILEYEEETFPLTLDSPIGTHLLRTLALKDAMDEHGYDGMFTGLRWDDRDARTDETFFTPRHEDDHYPPHDRVHPILHLTERDVWEAFFTHVLPEVVEGYPAGHVPESATDLPDGIEWASIPIPSPYFEVHRSLDDASPDDPSLDDSSLDDPSLDDPSLDDPSLDDQYPTGSDGAPVWCRALDSAPEPEGSTREGGGLMKWVRTLGDG